MKNKKKIVLRCLAMRKSFQKSFFIIFFFAWAIGTLAQIKVVKGVVLDTQGEPVIGASVVVKGVPNGVITDFDGKFSIQNIPDDATIQISFVGYKTQNILVKGKNYFNITLQEDAEMLEEVVVIGYGSVKKSDVTGALTQVSEKQIKERPVQNALQAMQGKAPQLTAVLEKWVKYVFAVIVP